MNFTRSLFLLILLQLKPTKTNDRSKPSLAGLRKFRKQMTIEEQIKKSESRATMPVDAPVEDEEDEMDDIDRLRDDLQSTKQMLSQELRNKEAQERENKRLLAKIQQMEAELERERGKSGGGGGEGGSSEVSSGTSSGSGSDEALVKALKQEAADAQKMSKDLEKKYNTIAEQLDAAKNDIDEKNRKIAALEKQLAEVGTIASCSGGQRKKIVELLYCKLIIPSMCWALNVLISSLQFSSTCDCRLGGWPKSGGGLLGHGRRLELLLAEGEE